jgi:alkane 1-monooxygenase
MKYLLAYSIPIVGILGIYYGGIWSYTALLFAFVLFPILELL